MSEYFPDKWVVVKISGYEDSPPIHKVFACWYGGWAGSDSWKLNSGITRVFEEGQCFSSDGGDGLHKCNRLPEMSQSSEMRVWRKNLSAKQKFATYLRYLREKYEGIRLCMV